MRARRSSLARAWREDWRATSEVTKVVVLLLVALLLAWAAFGIWFALTFQF